MLTGSFARTALPPPLASAVYNANNQLTGWSGTTFSYDANGNLLNDGVNSYVWDARNHLASISGGTSASFQYDAVGRRVGQSIGGIATNFLFDGANIVQELSGTTPKANLLNAGLDAVLTRTDSGGTSSYLSDGLGSTLALSDASGSIQTQYSYEPFGQTTPSGAPNGNQRQYTGRENDGTDLYYYRSRYYNPRTQRFISEDPIDFLGGQPNLYSYVGNRPTTSVDPSGNQIEEVVVLGAAGPVGWVILGGLVVVVGASIYVHTPAGQQLARDIGRALSKTAEDGTTADPVPVTADPTDTAPRKPPEPDPCKWPDNPEDMDKYLNREGKRVPDLPNTPGRNKVIWQVADEIKITFEAHPYDPIDWFIPGHSDGHWHLDTPGKRHQRFRPGDKIPGCKE